MRTFHGIIDVNKDGVISFDDFILLTERFINLGHLSENEAKEFQQIIKNLWEKQWGEINPYNLVTVEQYLEDMHHVLNDRELMKRAHSFLPYLFKVSNTKFTQINYSNTYFFGRRLTKTSPVRFPLKNSNCSSSVWVWVIKTRNFHSVQLMPIKMGKYLSKNL